METKNKWIAIGLVIVTLGIIIALVCKKHSVKSQVQSVQSLKTVKDWMSVSLNGFKFKYPRGYKLQEQEDDHFIADNQQTKIYVNLIKDVAKYESWIQMIKENLDSNSPSVDIQKVGQYTVYLESRMTAEGIFERNCFITLSDKLIKLTVATNGESEEPKIYKEVEQLADQILNTFDFNL